MNFSEISVKRPVAITMVFLIILLLGAVSLQRLNLDLLPEMNLPMALAMTEYSGAGPEEIENLITRPLEGALGTVNGVKNINSVSSRGQSVIMVEFAWGTDMNFALNQMREKIDLLTNVLPDGAQKPMLLKLDPNMMPIMVLGVGGDMDLATLGTLAEEVIQPNLERINGVASVSVEGGVTREIRISAIPQRLQAYGLTLDSIVNQLRMENRNTSAGTVEEGLKEHTVRVIGEFSNLQEIENLQLALPTGGYIRLADIAKIEDTFKDKKQLVYMNGQPSIQISLMKQTDANTVKVSDAVIAELAEIKKLLPPEADIKIAFDQAEYIRQSISNVASNAYAGALLAILILLLFLRNFRSTLIIGTAIPISAISTFILMYFGGLTLNMISLGGLALGVGMMVDNSIVILENIYRYRQEGHSRFEAAIKGAKEVGMAITASTLTSMVVFLPIVFVEGMAAQIFRPMALTVAFSLFSSLFVALTLVPMLSSKILRVDGSNGNGSPQGRFHFVAHLSRQWGRALDHLNARYQRVLHWSINNKKKVVFSTAVMVIISVCLLPFVGMEFMPSQDSGDYVISISMPQGTALQETQRVTELIDEFVRELPEHDWTFYAVGTGGMFGGSSDSATIQGKLKSKAERTRGINEVLDEITEYLLRFGQNELLLKLLGTSLNTLQGHTLAVAQHTLAVVLEGLGAYSQARKLTEQSLATFQKLGDRVGVSKSLHQLGILSLDQGEYIQAQDYTGQALTIFRELNDLSGVAKSKHQLGMLFQAQGEYTLALSHFKQALEIFQALNDRVGAAGSLHQLGMIYQAQGEYSRARDSYKESMKIDQELGDKAGLATSLHQLGLLHQLQRDYSQAQRLYEQSHMIFQELGDRMGLAGVFHQFGMLHQEQGEYNKAWECYKQSLATAQELGNKAGIAKSFHQMGRLYQDQGEYSQARSYFEKSLSILKEIGDRAGIAKSLHQLGMLHYIQGEFTQAFDHYKQ